MAKKIETIDSYDIRKQKFLDGVNALGDTYLITVKPVISYTASGALPVLSLIDRSSIPPEAPKPSRIIRK